MSLESNRGWIRKTSVLICECHFRPITTTTITITYHLQLHNELQMARSERSLMEQRLYHDLLANDMARTDETRAHLTAERLPSSDNVDFAEPERLCTILNEYFVSIKPALCWKRSMYTSPLDTLWSTLSFGTLSCCASYFSHVSWTSTPWFSPLFSLRTITSIIQTKASPRW